MATSEMLITAGDKALKVLSLRRFVFIHMAFLYLIHYFTILAQIYYLLLAGGTGYENHI